MIGYQEQLRRVILERTAPADAVESLGAEPWRWETYRRLVRNRLDETLHHGFERLRAFVGEERFRELADAFFDEEGPRSNYLRDLPGELLDWVERRGDAFLDPCALELARLERAELEIAYAPDGQRVGAIVELAMGLPVALCPSWRVLRLGYPVHRVVAGEPPPAREPTVLCLYRDVSMHAVHTLELTPVVGDLLDELARDRPLAEAIAAVAQRAGVTIDEPWLAALSAVLADFTERRLVLGSRA